MSQIRYFLGGNTPSGFYSLYHELSDPDKVHSLYILKGGAGCGKSSLMKRIARHAQAMGLETEQILCSGDPDSLDGIIIPALSAAVVDGTAPHVVEANFAGVMERYVDLSQFYDQTALRPLRDDVIAATREYQGHYKRVYRCLGAAGELYRDRCELMAADVVRQKLAKRAKGIISRELKGCPPGEGQLFQRFLTAVTHRGPVALWDTVTAQADRIYVLSDSCGLAHHLLSPILSAALAAGQTVVACPDPMAPDKLAHLILADLSLAFITDHPDLPFPHRPYRHLRLEAMADRELSRVSRPRLRFSRKVAAALEEEAIAGLAQAKTAHDKLEGLYNSHVDFEGVYAAADALAEEILALPLASEPGKVG